MTSEGRERILPRFFGCFLVDLLVDNFTAPEIPLVGCSALLYTPTGNVKITFFVLRTSLMIYWMVRTCHKGGVL